MPVGIVGSAATAFPHTGSNRARIDLVTSIAREVGGENDSDRKARALESLFAAIREYNGVLWDFNIKRTVVTLVAATQSYLLSQASPAATDFIAPYRALILDANGKLAGYEPLQFIRYDEWLDFSGNETSTGDPPAYYTFENLHEDGTIVYDPVPNGPSAAFPKVRHEYFREIALPSSDSAVLAVPLKIEHGIVELAKGYMVRSIVGPAAAQSLLSRADGIRIELEQRHRRYPDR